MGYHRKIENHWQVIRQEALVGGRNAENSGGGLVGAECVTIIMDHTVCNEGRN
jgi:hypothetical protein